MGQKVLRTETREWTFGAERGEGQTVYQVAAMKPDIL